MMIERLVVVSVLLAGLLVIASADRARAQTYDFETGPQGWAEGDPTGGGFGGDLFYRSSGGNPGGFLQGEDFIPGGGGMAIQAPAVVSGDLTRFEVVTWDALLPLGAVLSTTVAVKGTDGTYFRSENLASVTGIWRLRSATFQSDVGWTRLAGTASFTDVMTGADSVYIEIDVTSAGTEAGFDNVEFVLAPPSVPGLPPLAVSVLMFALGGVGVRCVRARAASLSGEARVGVPSRV